METKVIVKYDGVTEQTKKYVIEKAKDLARYYDRIRRIDATLDVERQKCIVSLVAYVSRGTQLYCSATGDDFISASNLALHKLERQLTKFKEKIKGHKNNMKKNF